MFLMGVPEPYSQSSQASNSPRGYYTINKSCFIFSLQEETQRSARNPQDVTDH